MKTGGKTKLVEAKLASSYRTLRFFALFLACITLGAFVFAERLDGDAAAVSAEKTSALLYVFSYDASQKGFDALIRSDMETLFEMGIPIVAPAELYNMTRNGALLLIENLCEIRSAADMQAFGFPFVLLTNASEDAAFHEVLDTIPNGSNMEIALKAGGSLTAIGTIAKLADASIAFFSRFGFAPKVCVFEDGSAASLMEEAPDMLKNMSCRIFIAAGSGINAPPSKASDCIWLTCSQRTQAECIESILNFRN